MADEDDYSESQEDPATLLKSLEKKALLNKYLFIGLLSFTGILFTVMGTGMTVMYLKLSQLSEAAEAQESQPYEEQFATLEQQLMLLADFRRSELTKINAYTAQLELISSDCSVEKAAPYRDFLLSRERDFQKFIETLSEGTSSLANMNQGSRQWLEAFTAEMDALRQSSAMREKTLEKLDAGKGG